MSQPTNSNGQYVRRVTLPSGRKIEVVYFETARREPRKAAMPATPPVDELHICPECDKDLVYPIDWEEASATHWEVELRCPNCEWSEVGTYDQATVDRFDEHLDLGTDALVKDLAPHGPGEHGGRSRALRRRPRTPTRSSPEDF